jgi:hypothetical protein
MKKTRNPLEIDITSPDRIRQALKQRLARAADNADVPVAVLLVLVSALEEYDQS